jgi:4'-phosphopantetheinyl transferase
VRTERLAPDALALWLLRPEVLQAWARLDLPLSPEEEAQAQALDPGARERFAGRHAFLHAVLAESAGLPLSSVRLEAGPRGKPRWAQGPGLQFSLSASQGWALLALAWVPVGADLEQLRVDGAWARVWERHFSPAERQCLQALGPQERAARGFRSWTQVEALLKLDGRGLRGLEQLAPDLEAERARHWVLSLEPGPGLVASVALERAPRAWSLREAVQPGQGPSHEIFGDQGSAPLRRG